MFIRGGVPLALAALIFGGLPKADARNAVGYVTVDLPAGLSLLANPLNTGDNNLNTVMPLPDTASGTVVYRFDINTQNYGNAQTFVGFGLGWQGDSLILNPGEGFFIQTLAPLTFIFVGEVPQGILSNPFPGAFKLSIRSSIAPEALPIGHGSDLTGPATGLEFPAVTGDTLYIFNPATQKYDQPWQYVEGMGWVSAAQPIAGAGPIIPVASSFIIQAAGPDRTWVRDFSVNLAESGPEPEASTEPSLLSLAIRGDQVTLKIANSSQVSFDVQFSSNRADWKTVAEDQTGSSWTGPYPGGNQGYYRIIPN